MARSVKLRWGILGVASINQRLIPAFARATNAELRAIASRSLDKARKAAVAAGISRAHGSYEALLDDPDVDVIYNPLPNSLHAEWTRKAAEHGKHVLCEKPLCPTGAEARQLVQFCGERGIKLMDGFMWPHHPRTARLREFLNRGGIGEVQHVVGAFTFPLEPFEPTNIRLTPELAGGSLLDVGCYPVYGIRWAFGAEPVRVFATARYSHGVDIEMSGTICLSDGRSASFDCGFTLPFRSWLEIAGTEGVLRIPEMWVPQGRATYEVYRDRKEPQEFSLEGEDQIVHMIQNFSDAVLNNHIVRPSPEEAVRTLRVLDSLAKSAKEGHFVAV